MKANDIRRSSDLTARIEEMNQRGGRMLSIVDLIHAGTVSLDVAAYFLGKMRNGVSVLTCAGPGGVGKTTLLGAILGLAPSNATVIPVGAGAGRLIRADTDGPVWYLCHEVGDGTYYGYLWGQDVGRFLSLAGERHFIAATVHADSFPELARHLMQTPVRVSLAQLACVHFIAFIHNVPTSESWGHARRVVEVWESDGKQHHLKFRWDPKTDTHVSVGEVSIPVEATCSLQQILASGARDLAAVRQMLNV